MRRLFACLEVKTRNRDITTETKMHQTGIAQAPSHRSSAHIRKAASGEAASFFIKD